MIVIILIQLPFFSISAVASEVESEISQLPELESETAVLINANTGQILYQKNKDKKMYPASITKIMTAMLALKYGNLSDSITMSYDAVFSMDRQSSHIALDVEEKITLEQALYALGIESANDAANGIAELIGGSMEGFTNLMNVEVERLGLRNTKFTNAHGLPDESHYTTAYDIALISSEAIKTSKFSKFFNTKRYEVPPSNKQPKTRYFNNSNKFFNGVMPYDGVFMSKTGWTSEAQHTMVTAAQRNGITLIVAVMKSSQADQKWNDTIALLDYGFNKHYQMSIENSFLQRKLNVNNVELQELSGENVVFANDLPTVLLPIEKSLEDISITLQTKGMDSEEYSACLQIPSDNENQPIELMDVPVSINYPVVSSESVQPDTTNEDSSEPSRMIFRLLIIGMFLLLSYRVLTLYYRRKIRKKRRLQRQHNARLRHSQNCEYWRQQKK